MEQYTQIFSSISMESGISWQLILTKYQNSKVKICLLCIYLHIHAVKNTTICQMVSLCNMQHYVMYSYMFRPCKWVIIRLFGLGEDEISPPLPPNSYCIVTLRVLRKTWWWLTYKVETCSCTLHSVAYYIVTPSDKLLCFWLHVYVIIYTLYTLCYWPNTRGMTHLKMKICPTFWAERERHVTTHTSLFNLPT